MTTQHASLKLTNRSRTTPCTRDWQCADGSVRPYGGVWVRLGACTALVALAIGCGGSTDNNGSTDGGAGESGDATTMPPVPPIPTGGHSGSMATPQEDAGDDECGLSPFAATVVPANVLLVIDVSGSMHATPEGFEAGLWPAMRSSLESSLDAVKDRLRLGMSLYPSGGECTVAQGHEVHVSVGSGEETFPEIVDVLNATTPAGATPTAAALAQALAHYTEGAGAALDGEKFVLLATDGGPNCNPALSCEADRCTANLEGVCPGSAPGGNCCNHGVIGDDARLGCLDDDATLAQIEALAAADIQTFVVGIPGSEPYAEALDRFAEAGQRPNSEGDHRYYAVTAAGTGAGGLSATLMAITTSLITSCRQQLHEQPPDIHRLNVEIDGELIPQQGDDGWTLDQSTNPPTVEIKGETCARIERDGIEHMKVVFGCPTLVIR